MHVDGFRFDLASALARGLHDVDRLHAFFDLIQQDPVVSGVKLIAEPWDVGEGGYQVGNFPPLWSEWNGRYRDTVRDYWRGEPATIAEFAYRFTGSSDLYAGDSSPGSSINFVTAHDGFTLADLVSYNEHAQRGQRRGRSRRRAAQPLLEPRGRGAHRRSRRPRAARPADAQHARDAVAEPGRPDAADGRRGRPHPARQQQRLLPGQRAELVRLGPTSSATPSCSSSPRSSSRCAATIPCSTGAVGSPGATSAATRSPASATASAHWVTSPGCVPTVRRCRTTTGRSGYARALGVLLNGAAVPDPGPRGEPS